MSRLEGIADGDAGLFTRLVYRGAKAKRGEVPDPLRLMAHSGATMWAAGFFEIAFERATSVPATLKALAQIKTSARIGCLF